MNSQKGIAHILLIVLLVIGVGLTTYLVTQKTNFFPRASTLSGPITPTPTPVSTCTACRSDINQDGKVNMVDVSILIGCFNKSSTDKDANGNSCAAADINGDGIVSILDFSCLKNYFGQSCTPTPTPSPSSLTLGHQCSGSQAKLTFSLSVLSGRDVAPVSDAYYYNIYVNDLNDPNGGDYSCVSTYNAANQDACVEKFDGSVDYASGTPKETAVNILPSPSGYSLTMEIAPGHNYDWKAVACNKKSGVCGSEVHDQFTCPKSVINECSQSCDNPNPCVAGLQCIQQNNLDGSQVCRNAKCPKDSTCKCGSVPAPILSQSCEGSKVKLNFAPSGEAGIFPLYSKIYVNDLNDPNGTAYSCVSAASAANQDACAEISGSSYTISMTPGHNYDWKAVTCYENGGCSSEVHSQFICPLP